MHGLMGSHSPVRAILTSDERQLGRSLRTWRTLHRIKQSHAAQLLGVSQATISRWENGQVPPTPDESARLRELMAARLTSAADRVLAQLVTRSSTAVHLVCDFTHRLLAVSPQRERQFHVPTDALMGTSLWRFATEDIVLAESQLAARGWFGPTPPAIEFQTRARHGGDLSIPASGIRWVRFQLSDGSFARLVETIDLSAAGRGVAAPATAGSGARGEMAGRTGHR
jgi:transcriptional regulator with XRE-family HTH domain